MDESKLDPFDQESMEIRYKVGDKTLILRPLKWGAFRKLSKLTPSTTEDEGNYVFSMLQILFPGDEHKFLTKEFFENEMTLGMSSVIIKKATEMNGIDKSKGVA